MTCDMKNRKCGIVVGVFLVDVDAFFQLVCDFL